MKTCTKCKKTKPTSQFNKAIKSKDGFSWACKDCHNKKSKKYYAQPKIREQHAEAHLLKRYGLTLEDYNTKLVEQNGCCAMCGKHWTEFKKRLHVDHNHATGQVRGLLCATCNSGLPWVENKNFKSEAEEYLRFWYEDIT